MPMHSVAPCACLGLWRLCPAPYSVCRAESRPLRLGGIAAHSRRGGGASPTTSLVITIAAWQTMPCCAALLPKRADLNVRREDGASAFLHHTGDACSLAVVAQTVQIASVGPGLLVLRRSSSASGTACKRPASSISQEGTSTEAVPPASAVRRWFYASLFIILQEEEWSPQDSQDVLDEASSQLEPLAGLDLFERIWVLPEGRDLPRLMQAFRERFGVRFGRCLELLQAPAATPAGLLNMYPHVWSVLRRHTSTVLYVLLKPPEKLDSTTDQGRLTTRESSHGSGALPIPFLVSGGESASVTGDRNLIPGLG